MSHWLVYCRWSAMVIIIRFLEVITLVVVITFVEVIVLVAICILVIAITFVEVITLIVVIALHNVFFSGDVVLWCCEIGGYLCRGVSGVVAMSVVVAVVGGGDVLAIVAMVIIVVMVIFCIIDYFNSDGHVV